MLRTYNKGDNTAEKTEIVYTEDGFPVYTLFIDNISGETEDEIRNYFSKFGEIESVKLFNASDEDPDENKLYNGYVTFAKSEYAARALNSATHLLLGKNLEVKPADSCHQQKIPRKLSAELKKNAGTGNALSIVELNDDCLGHIFAFLSQSEMFKVALSCQRFLNLIKYKVESDKHFDLENIHEDFTTAEAERILSAFGDRIKRLQLIYKYAVDEYRQLLEIIPKYCRNLEEIDFRNFDRISSAIFHKILPNCKQLKSLTLQRCVLDEKAIELLEALTELRSLDISSNYQITGKYLKNLKSLKHLNISHCINIQTRHFADMWESGMKLKELIIKGFSRFDYEALISTQKELESLTLTYENESEFLKFIDHLPILKHLRIYNNCSGRNFSLGLDSLSTLRQETLESLEIYFSICVLKVNRDSVLSLKNLKKLSIVNDRYLDDKYLMAIGESCEQLEHINISGSCRKVTENGIISIMQNLENLIFLDISPARKFDSALLNAINDVLKKRKTKMLHRFTLAVSNTVIAEIWKSQSYLEHGKLMALSLREDLSYAESDDGVYDSDYANDYIYDSDTSDVFISSYHF